MSNNNQKPTAETLNISERLQLMEIYLTEWMHRDNLLWSHTIKLFYAILITIFLPNIARYLKIDLPIVPSVVFPVIGVLMSILFLYVSLGYSARLHASGDTYKKLIDSMPEKWQRVPVEDLKTKKKNYKFGRLFKPRTSYLVCFTMFGVLFALSVVMIVISISR